jgi:DNA-binding transcriptional LysR family regulator
MEAMDADWDDLRVFLALSREGNLTKTARLLSVSHPTVGRRIKSLEGKLGARLFDRLPDRFVLTAAGEELLADARAMEQAAESIQRRSAGMVESAQGSVRLSASEDMTGFLVQQLPWLERQLPAIELELVASHMLANLSRREADLLIRVQVPELASLVARRLGRAAYGVYARRGSPLAATSPAALSGSAWVSFDEEHSYMTGQRWLAELLGGAPVRVRVNNWLVLQAAVRVGAGLGLLPCYLGDADPDLQRVGPIVREVAADQWLLVHRDLRALPRVRAVMDALVALFHNQRAMLEGRLARPGARAKRRAHA